MGKSLHNTRAMYSSDEKLCLKWNDFQANVSSAFGTLREDREFADVTLVCEDGQQVEAHKVILTSSSPFFLNLLRRNKHPHPLIYMRGLKSQDLVAMVDFFYFGEANVYQENLESFLAMAEELQLKGLMGSGAEKEAEERNNKLPYLVQQKTPKPVKLTFYPKKETTSPELQKYMGKFETEDPLEGTVAVTDLQDLNARINSMIEKSENKNENPGINGNSGGFKRICRVCGKEGKRNNIRDHIEANHIAGVSHNCNICGKVFKTTNSLRNHNSV